MIHQGEQYLLPFKITDSEGTVITPSTCTDVRIKINTMLKEYSESQLTYDSTRKVWLFQLTESNTQAMRYKVPVELSVKFSDGTIIKSNIQWVDIAESIITEGWQ